MISSCFSFLHLFVIYAHIYIISSSVFCCVLFLCVCAHTRTGDLYFVIAIQAISSFNVVNMCLPRFLQEMCENCPLYIHTQYTDTKRHRAVAAEIKSKTARWYTVHRAEWESNKNNNKRTPATCVGGKRQNNGGISNTGWLEIENKIRGDRKRKEMK